MQSIVLLKGICLPGNSCSGQVRVAGDGAIYRCDAQPLERGLLEEESLAVEEGRDRDVADDDFMGAPPERESPLLVQLHRRLGSQLVELRVAVPRDVVARTSGEQRREEALRVWSAGLERRWLVALPASLPPSRWPCTGCCHRNQTWPLNVPATEPGVYSSFLRTCWGSLPLGSESLEYAVDCSWVWVFFR